MIELGRGKGYRIYGSPFATRNYQAKSLEEINLIGLSDNTLTLDVLEVLNISDTSNTLIVRSSHTDIVNLGGGWTEAGLKLIDGIVFHVFTQGAATVLHDVGLETTTTTYPSTDVGKPLKDAKNAVKPGVTNFPAASMTVP